MRETPLLHRYHFIAFFLVLFSLPVAVKSQGISIKLGYRRPLNTDWFGLNTQNATRGGIWIAEPHVLQKVPLLHPQGLRFPGGAIANWWDWKRGWFVDDPEVLALFPNVTPVPNTLENFKKLVQATGATPMFDLNMISSNLGYQLAMLKHADSIGLEVKNIELGNEFYLVEEGDSSIVYSIFPTAESYGTECTKWIDSIHHYFPNAKVAAQGAFDRTGPERRLTWDTSLVKTLEGENAISFHHYYNASGTEARGEGDGNYTMDDVPEFMSRPFKAWNILATKDLPTVRPGREIWITEDNMQDTSIPVHGSWGHGLFVAVQSLLYLESQLIKHIYFYTMDGSAYGAYFYDRHGLSFAEQSIFVPPPDPPSTTPWSLSAAGIAVNAIAGAMNGMTNASPLVFTNIPSISILDDGDSLTYPSLYGWEFSNGSGSSAIVVNVTGTQYTIPTISVFPGTGSYVQYYSSPTDYIPDGNLIPTNQGNLGSVMNFAPYSITRITSSYVPPSPPSVTISVNKPPSICEGDSVLLDAGSGHALYQWSTGSTKRKIWVQSSGDYWVRVWNNLNGYCAADTLSVMVHAFPEIPTILNSGKDEFCQGQSVTLSVKTVVPQVNYIWSNGVTASSLQVNQAGNYSLKAIDNYGCYVFSDTTSIKVFPLPIPVITPSGPVNLCSGLYVKLFTEQPYNAYHWSNDKYGLSIKIGTTGSYFVTVTDSNKCSATSAPVDVTVHALPSPVVTVNGPASFCTGILTTYLSTQSGYHYQWNKGSGPIAGATNFQFWPAAAGSYSVTSTDTLFSCVKKSSAVQISILNLPQAHISIAGSKNICNGEIRILTANIGTGYSYQWLKDGLAISGANLVTYIAGTAGNYSCKVIDGNGCDKISNSIILTSNCKETSRIENKTGINVYPNPAADEIYFDGNFNNSDGGICIIEIQNVSGKILRREEKYSSEPQINGHIDLDKNLPNGIYLIIAKYNGEILNSKFLISR